MIPWIRFIFTAFFLIAGLAGFASGVLGVFRFGFVMNRMHAGGIGDTFGLFFIMLALIIGSGVNMDSLKLLLLVVFMWCTSPVSTHFLSQIEYDTNDHLFDRVKTEEEGDKENGTDRIV